MLEVNTLHDLANYVGKSLGHGDWVLVDQDLINRFADVTGDDNWYHVDIERCKKELPGGHTIAHGLLTLSLTPVMSRGVLKVLNHGRALNYGYDRIRFTKPVVAGARVRMHMAVKGYEKQTDGAVLTRECKMEIEGESKPAMIADMLSFVYY
ncbi:MAG: MaoC family dehydratase [Janthinobacterium lividum]